jgi:hypothetical protein
MPDEQRRMLKLLQPQASSWRQAAGRRGWRQQAILHSLYQTSGRSYDQRRSSQHRLLGWGRTQTGHAATPSSSTGNPKRWCRAMASM